MLSLESGKPPLIGDRFELAGSIDHSGTTWTYLAWDRQEDRWVTVRMLSFRASRDAVARSRFEREVRCLQQVKHPAVLEVYAGEPQHRYHPWVAVAAAEGGSVADWIRQHGPMPAYLAIDVMAHVCSALSAAHRAGVSHGGLKLEHVLIDRHGHCRLTGLRGGAERGDVQTDVKSAGALLFTMVTGRRWDDKGATGLLTTVPLAIARPIENTRKGRGGYADVSTFSRDLEAAVLELPMPDGSVPPLAGPDVALPEDPAEVFDPTATFPELQHFLMLAADPEYEPGEDIVDPPTPVSEGLDFPTGGSGSSRFQAESADDPSSEQKMAAMPYQMSRPSGANAKAEFDGDAYKVGDKPLYEDAPDGSEDQWKHWDPAEGKKDEPAQPVAEDKPVLDDKMLGRLVVLAGLFFVAAIVGSVVYGTMKVGEARAATEQLAGTLVEQVRGETQLVYDLGSAGGDRKALEDAYFEFAEARNDVARTQAALQFAQLAQQEAEAAGVDPVTNGGHTTELSERVSTLSQQRLEVMAKRGEWARQASGFPGVVPVVLGIQIAPPY